MHDTKRLSFAGAVDADGHILEPPDLWETYLEPKYRDRALAARSRRERARGARDRRRPVEDEPAWASRRRSARWAIPTSARCSSIPTAPTSREAPFGSMDPERAHRGARRRGHRRGRVVHDDRLVVGGRARRRRAEPGLHPRVQPLDLRVLLGQPAAGPDRAPVVERSGRGRARSWNAPSAKARAARTSRRSRTTAGRSVIPTTIPSSRPPKTSTCRSRSIRPSNRSGPRARAWERGST